jgi:hypothetical protein
MSISYDHPAHGEITAVPVRVSDHDTPMSVDWVATRTRDGQVLGYVVDDRWNFDDDWQPLETTPDDENDMPFEAYHTDRSYIAALHSLRGALAVIGNNRSPA